MKQFTKKAAYFVVSSDFTWRRSVNLMDLIKHYSKLRYDYNIYQMVFNDCKDEEVEKMMYCFAVTGLGSLVRCNDLTKEDNDMLEKYFIGWVTIECKGKKLRAKSKKDTAAKRNKSQTLKDKLEEHFKF